MRRSRFSFRLRTLVFLAPLVAIAAGLGIRAYLESQVEPLDEVIGDRAFFEEVQKRNRIHINGTGIVQPYEGPLRIRDGLVEHPLLGTDDDSTRADANGADDPNGEDPFASY